tara:strand:+ start:1279 stop:1866 length:588 start_codon:yes stop_codon:yes gene_type:complete
MEKTVNIDNFIGVYDGYITPASCDDAIKLFEDQNKFNKTINRISLQDKPITEIQDQQYFAAPGNINIWYKELQPILVNYEQAFRHYIQHTGAKDVCGEFNYTVVKIQKTLPTEGYHVWHIEHGAGYDNEPRSLVYTIYLNDVEEGGETEFLHFSKRVKAKKGRIVIWPAGFPYVHRGNSPLSGEKYILTSWMCLR